MGTPYWDMYARGAILGLTRGTTREHIARATLEAIAYQVKDLIDCMNEDAYSPVDSLKVDGGASVSNIMMQFQSDILQMNVIRPEIVETTSMGAAFMAGIQTGVWSGVEEIRIWKTEYSPKMKKEQSRKLYSGWKRRSNVRALVK